MANYHYSMTIVTEPSFERFTDIDLWHELQSLSFTSVGQRSVTGTHYQVSVSANPNAGNI